MLLSLRRFFLYIFVGLILRCKAWEKLVFDMIKDLNILVDILRSIICFQQGFWGLLMHVKFPAVSAFASKLYQ